MELVRLVSLDPVGWPAPAVTVGNFDGVHRGHQALVEAVVEEAAATGGTAVVVTFDPHPSSVLGPDRAPATLITVGQKRELLGSLGARRLVLIPFTREFSQQTPEDFVQRVLGECLGARLVVVGSNFRFGRGRAGDLSMLERLGQGSGMEVRGVDPIDHGGAPISSTRIREALARGTVESATAMLGRPYSVDGTVIPGEGRGRTIGVPTANLHVHNETLPSSGVYACWCQDLIQSDSPGLALPSVLNIGRRPTFGGGTTTVEAHLLDYSGDLYGRQLRLSFQARLREERHFASVDALISQIQVDVANARRILAPGG